MANGKQLAEQNWQAFNTWLASKTDADFVQMTSRGVLSRKEIATECSFSKSVLDQNPRIKAALRATEKDLRDRGILPSVAEPPNEEHTVLVMQQVSNRRTAFDRERLQRLEQENAALRAETVELKRQIERFSTLQEAISLTGRMPR